MTNKSFFATILCIVCINNTLFGDRFDLFKQEAKKPIVLLTKESQSLLFPLSNKTVYATGGTISGSVAVYLAYDTFYNATSCHTSNRSGKDKSLAVETALIIPFVLLTNYFIKKYLEENPQK